MKKMSLDELKKVELSIMIFIDDFCKRNNIDYSLCGGTAIGAVRHKGFIPWDDDIDIMLTRDNYDRFVKLFKQQTDKRYAVITENDENYNYLFSKVYDTRTIIIDDNISRFKNKLGVYVDIMPIDYLGNTKKEAEKRFDKTKFLRSVLVASNWRKFFINKNYGFFRQIIRWIFYFISRFPNPKDIIGAINKSYKKYLPKEAQYVGCICGSNGHNDIFEASLFSAYRYIEFENNSFKVVSDIDLYLTIVFGNYMELPPIEKRQNKHYFDAFYLEDSEGNE